MSSELVPKWKISGDYFETCNCDVACPCIFFSPVPQGLCDYVGVWNIEEGKFGETQLDNLNVVLAARSPETNRIMFDGNWKAAFYFDAKSTKKQYDALSKIFTGKAGGPLFPQITHLISQLAVKQAKIEFRKEKNESKFFCVCVRNHGCLNRNRCRFRKYASGDS